MVDHRVTLLVACRVAVTQTGDDFSLCLPAYSGHQEKLGSEACIVLNAVQMLHKSLHENSSPTQKRKNEKVKSLHACQDCCSS